MKKTLAIIIVGITVLLTFTVMYLVFVLQKDDDNFHETMPAPTEVTHMQAEGEENSKQREAYFEAMHRTAPGTNWKKMDADLRFKLMQDRAALSSYKIAGGEWDTVADGNVVGKWDELGSFNTAGRIWATEVDYANDVVYAFSDGGNLWKGDIDGSNWSVINDNFKIAASHLLRKIGDRIIAATPQWGVQGIFYTDDEGLTWNTTTGLENVANWGYIVDAEMLNDAEHTMYVLAYEWDYTNWWDIVSVYKSTDLGESFEKLMSYDVPTYGGTNNFVLWAAYSGEPVCYMVENNNVRVFDESGTLNNLGTLPIIDDGDVMMSGFEGVAATVLYVANYNYVSGNTDIYKSGDGGLTWSFTGSVDEYLFSKNSFSCSQKTEDYLYYGGLDTHRSFNGGVSWVRNNYWWEYYDNVENNLHADIPFVRTFVDPGSGQEMVLISTDGGLYKSLDAGLTWNNITVEGMRNAQYYDVYTYRYVPDIIFAGSQDQGYQRSAYDIDGDYYFDQLISGDYGHFVSRSGGDNLWCIYPGFAMYIDDAAAGSNMFFWDFIGYGHLWMAPIMQDPLDNEVIWWGGGSDAGGAYLWRVEKSGPTVTGVKQAKNFSVAGGGAISAINYSPIDPNYWYLLTTGGNFYYSTDAGETWTLSSGFDGPGSHYFYGASIEPSKTTLGVVYVGGSGYDNPAVYVTEDNGESFTGLTDGLPSTLVYDLAITENDSLLFAATEVAPYVYVKAENKWYNIAATDAPLQTYWSVEYVEEIKAVRYGTYGRGAWEFKLYEEETNISVNEVAANSDLNVYPNPANDFINIKIDAFIPNATIEVINMQGEIVFTKQAALNKNVAFNVNVAQLKSGNYFLRINGGSKAYLEKLIITN
jgi:hypothetical protein